MKRTNIYLDVGQIEVLDRQARARGVSRAELIRQLIERDAAGGGAADLASDLAAIRESFGGLQQDDAAVGRSPDERSRYLERLARP